MLRWSRVRRTKLMLKKSLIRQVVRYGLETSTLLAQDLDVLGIFEWKVLLTIYGGVQMEDEEWRNE